MATPGQDSLSTFYESVLHDNPTLAALMHRDIITVALWAHSDTKPSRSQEAAENLRQQSRDLPETLRRVLESALSELGYS